MDPYLPSSLIMVSGVMGQSTAAGSAGACAARTARTTFSTSIMPHPCSILSRFSCGRWKGLRRCRGWCGLRLLGMVGLVMHVCRTTNRTISLIGASAARTIIGTNIMRDITCRSGKCSTWPCRSSGGTAALQGIGSFIPYGAVPVTGKSGCE